jgi:hypothetical protein
MRAFNERTVPYGKIQSIETFDVAAPNLNASLSCFECKGHSILVRSTNTNLFSFPNY